MSAAELKERRELEKAAQKKIDRRKRVVERLDDKSGIDAETGEPVQIEEEVHERTDQIRWKTGHLAPRAYAEGPPVRPPGSPPEAAKRKAAKMRASGQHWGTCSKMQLAASRASWARRRRAVVARRCGVSAGSGVRGRRPGACVAASGTRTRRRGASSVIRLGAAGPWPSSAVRAAQRRTTASSTPSRRQKRLRTDGTYAQCLATTRTRRLEVVALRVLGGQVELDQGHSQMILELLGNFRRNRPASSRASRGRPGRTAR